MAADTEEEKVICEHYATCTDNTCLEKKPHTVRRDGHYSCKRRTTCQETGRVCGCVEVSLMFKKAVLPISSLKEARLVVMKCRKNGRVR